MYCPGSYGDRTLSSMVKYDDHADSVYELFRKDFNFIPCLPQHFSREKSTCNDPSLCCRNHSWNYFGACAEPYGISWKSDPVCDGTSELPFSFRKECIPVDVDKAKDFIQRAFTVIFVATIIIWFLQTFDTRLNVVADSSNSLLALVGKMDHCFCTAWVL